MGMLFLEYPRLSVSVSVPDDVADLFQRNFADALVSASPAVVHHEFHVQFQSTGVSLAKNGVLAGTFPNATELMYFLEEDLENSLIKRLGGWIGLHAGAVALHDIAIVTVGHPDTGKTTTTFQLVELGLELLCEEVTPIDPATISVQPFPQVLTLSRSYAEAFASRYPVVGGTISYHGPEMARYSAAKVRKQAVPLGAILFPAFDPSCTPRIEELTPAQVLTDLFQYCFAPTVDDEQLYDNAIRVVERCRLFRMRTCSIESARALLAELLSELSKVGSRNVTASLRSSTPT